MSIKYYKLIFNCFTHRQDTLIYIYSTLKAQIIRDWMTERMRMKMSKQTNFVWNRYNYKSISYENGIYSYEYTTAKLLTQSLKILKLYFIQSCFFPSSSSKKNSFQWLYFFFQTEFPVISLNIQLKEKNLIFIDRTIQKKNCFCL